MEERTWAVEDPWVAAEGTMVVVHPFEEHILVVVEDTIVEHILKVVAKVPLVADLVVVPRNSHHHHLFNLVKVINYQSFLIL